MYMVQDVVKLRYCTENKVDRMLPWVTQPIKMPLAARQ